MRCTKYTRCTRCIIRCTRYIICMRYTKLYKIYRYIMRCKRYTICIKCTTYIRYIKDMRKYEIDENTLSWLVFYQISLILNND